MAALSLTLPVFGNYLYPVAKEGFLVHRQLVERKMDLEEYRRTVSNEYAEAAEAADFLRKQHYHGPIMVFGDPNIYLNTGNAQAMALLGQDYHFLVRKHWEVYLENLTARPPKYIFVEQMFFLAIAVRSPALDEFLKTSYEVVADLPGGSWLARRRKPRTIRLS